MKPKLPYKYYRLIAKDIEISTDCDEFEWEDHMELATEVLSRRAPGADYCFVTASNIDWQRNSGCGIFDLSEDAYKHFWQKIAGWDNADFTLRIEKIETEKGKPLTEFIAVAYSHDTPTGGGRKVRFMTGKQVADILLLDGTIKRLREVEEAFGVKTKKELYSYLDSNYAADEIRELL